MTTTTSNEGGDDVDRSEDHQEEESSSHDEATAEEDKEQRSEVMARVEEDDGIKSKPSPPAYIGLVMFCLFCLGVYDVAVTSTSTANPCQMTYMYELPHYVDLNLTTANSDVNPSTSLTVNLSTGKSIRHNK